MKAHRTEDPEIKYMTRDQAAKRYAVSLRQIASMLAGGVLPRVKLGRKCIRIPIQEADTTMRRLVTGGEFR